MPIVQLVVWALIALIGLSILVSSQVIELLLTLVMAGLVGALARAVIPGRLPGGWAGALLAGMAGAWLGGLLLGHWGPSLASFYLIPAFLGALILAFLVQFVTGVLGR